MAQKISIVFDASMNVSQIKEAANQINNSLQKIKLPDNLSASFSKVFDKLNKEIETFRDLSSRELTSMGDISKVTRSFNKISDSFTELRALSEKVEGLDPNKLLPKELIERTTKLNKDWGVLSKTMSKKNNASKEFDKQNKALKAQQKELDELKRKRDEVDTALKNTGGLKGGAVTRLRNAQKAEQRAIEEYDRLIKEEGKAKNDPSVLAAAGRATRERGIAKSAQEEINKLNKDITDGRAKLDKYKVGIEQLEPRVKDLAVVVEKLKSEAEASPEGLTKLRTEIAKIQNVDISEVPEDMEQLSRIINSLNDDAIEEIRKNLDNVGAAAEGTRAPLGEARRNIQELGEQGEQLSRTAAEVDNLKNRILDFFSISNAIQLFKNSIRSAFETVKELDKTMTETAVVTDFSVSDMWNQLPEYTKRANELGVATNDAYAAATLYYQQGLKTNEVVSVSNETLKMARIAGIEAAEATDYMTAALRGFNMEVNEASAQRVNDVYSELAAITASDTQEISVAMTKVASLAHNANMEFETTAAFLAQGIETTRESAETIGTALKTVIARFSEVKELYSQGELLGTDEEGQEIDVNKVSEALRSAGINLNEYLTGMKGLDDIFLELASKWDSLDIVQQRYLATMAAGSRQQSRFIAMMSNYGRTMELVDAASNSTGASQEQFNKTLDSMQTKLAKLKNAWDQFALGLANNDVIKFGIDLLTGFINAVNGLTNALSGGNGLIRSVISLGTAFMGLKGARAIFNGFTGTLGKEGVKAGKSYSESFAKEFGDMFGKIKGFFSGNNIGKGNASIPKFKNELGSLSQTYFQLGETLKNTSLEDPGYEELAAKVEMAKDKFDSYEPSIEKINFENAEYAKVLKLTTEQQKVQNALTDKGVSTLLAARAAQAGLTVEEAESIIISMQKTGATESEIDAELRKQALEKSGQKYTLKGIALSISDTVAKKASAYASEGRTGALFAEKIAQLALNHSMLVGLGIMGLIAAATVGLIAGLVQLGKAIKDASPEGQLEKAKEAAKEASRAADEAKESYDDLKTSLDNLDDKKTTLEGLTEGTQEWKDAVKELNEEVFALIEKYPELSNFVKLGEGGALELDYEKVVDEKTVNDILAQYEENAGRARAVDVGAQIDVVEKSNRAVAREIANEFFKTTGSAMQGTKMDVNEDQIESIAKAVYSGSINSADDLRVKGANYGINVVGKTNEEIIEIINSLRNLGRSLSEASIQTDAFAKSLATDILANYEGTNREAVSGFLDSQISNFLSRSRGIIDKRGISDETAQEMADFYGGIISDGKIVYEVKNENGETVEKELDLSSDQAKAQAAAIETQKVGAESAEKFNEALDMLSTSGNEAAKRLFEASEGVKLTQEDAKKFDKIDFDTIDTAYKKYGESAAAALFADESGMDIRSVYEMSGAYDSWDAFIKHMQISIENANDSFIASEEKFTDNFSEGTRTNLEAMNNINYEQMEGLSNKLFSLIAEEGDAAGTAISERVKNITNEMTPEEADQFVETLNSLNWDSVDDIEGFSDKLKDLGIAIPDEEVDEFEQTLIELSGAVRQVDLEGIKEQISSLSSIRSGIVSGEQERSFSSETMQTLVDANAASLEDFAYNFDTDSYIYIGESTNQIVQAIEQQTSDLLNQNADQLKSDIAGAEIAKDLMNDPDYNSNDYASQIELLRQYSEQMLAQGYEGYNLDTLSTLEEMALGGNKTAQDQITEMIGAISSLIINEAENREKYAQVSALTPVETSSNAQLSNIAMGADLTKFGTDAAEGTTIGDNEKAANQILAMAGAYSECEDEIREFNDAVAEYNREGASAEDQSKAMTKAQTALKKALASAEIEEMRKKLKALSSAVSETLEELDDLEPGTEEYQKAIADLSNEVNKYLGFDLAADFFEDAENMQLLKDALDGSQDAWNTLSVNMQKAQVNSSEFANQFGIDGDYIINICNTLDGLEFDINGRADMSQVVAALEAAGIKGQEVARVLEALGYSNIEYEVDYGYMSVPIGANKADGNTNSRNPMMSSDAGGGSFTGAAGVTFKQVKYPKGIRVKSATNAFAASTSGTGFGRGGGGSSGGGGGGGGSDKEESWENPYDWLYNLTEKINKNLREREKLERRYNKLVESRRTTAEELSKNSQAELDKLRKQNELQNEMLSKRKIEMQRELDENAELSKYGSYNFDNGLIQIDWNLIDSVTDTEEGEKIEEYISKLEEIRDQIWDAEDAIEDVEDQIQEINERGKDEYTSLEDKIKEAIINARQEEIDRLTAINDSINDTNSKILDSMQKTIEQQRQDRDNQKTEDEIAEKQRQLVYLQQDTSGANDLEILSLQDEIAESQESYTDQLIDQKISELQEQNDAAAEQRQQQIDILQAQLDYDRTYGIIAAQTTQAIRALMEGSTGGVIIDGTNLANLLKNSEEFQSLTGFAKAEWWADLQTESALATMYYKDQLAKYSERNFDSEIRNAVANKNYDLAKELEMMRNYKIELLGLSDKKTYSYMNGDWTQWGDRKPTPTPTPTPAPAPTQPAAQPQPQQNQISVGGRINAAGAKIYSNPGASRGYGQYFSNDPVYIVLDEKNGFLKVRHHSTSSGVSGWFRKSDVKAFKTGGLADFTGPAWLDGTPSRPELIFNQKDSQNLIQLKDILASLFNTKSSNKSENSGDNYYDIDINVEKINDDYDVEQIALKIKDMIRTDATYRNVNVISNMR